MPPRPPKKHTAHGAPTWTCPWGGCSEGWMELQLRGSPPLRGPWGVWSEWRSGGREEPQKSRPGVWPGRPLPRGDGGIQMPRAVPGEWLDGLHPWHPANEETEAQWWKRHAAHPRLATFPHPLSYLGGPDTGDTSSWRPARR